MKTFLILIKIDENTFVKNKYLTLFLGPEGRKVPENHEMYPISNLNSLKSIYLKTYIMIYNLNNS